MQFHLDRAELNLVADVLLEVSRTSHADDTLMEKILAKDLRLDGNELERLGELLGNRKRELKDEIARMQNTPECAGLQQKLAVLERAKEKVNEACVMF